MTRFTSDAFEIVQALQSEHAALAMLRESLQDHMRACGTVRLRCCEVPLAHDPSHTDAVADDLALRVTLIDSGARRCSTSRMRWAKQQWISSAAA